MNILGAVNLVGNESPNRTFGILCGLAIQFDRKRIEAGVEGRHDALSLSSVFRKGDTRIKAPRSGHEESVLGRELALLAKRLGTGGSPRHCRSFCGRIRI